VAGLTIDACIALLDAAREAHDARVASAPPWTGWLVVSLLVQRERQRWHREVVSWRLADAQNHHGDVPGLDGWTFHRHGMGCCLVGADGEILDVDLRDRQAAIVDPWFFANRIESIAHARVAEGRLWRWRPKTDLIVDGLDELADAGVIARRDNSHLFTLAAPLAERASEVTRDLEAPGAAERWRRALGDRDDERQRSAHAAWLVGLIRESRNGAVLDVAFDAVGMDAGYGLLRAQLGGPIDYAAGRAIELLRAHRELPPCPEVAALLRRVAPEDDPPYAGYQAVAYLLERELEPALARARFDELAAVEVSPGSSINPFCSAFAILALRFMPDRALPLVRKALRSKGALCVEEMAAILALLDQRWCHRELCAALAEERAATHPYLVAALRRSSSELARRRAAAANIAPPHEPGAAGFTYEEVTYASAEPLMENAVARARSVAAELQGRLPDDWGAEDRSELPE